MKKLDEVFVIVDKFGDEYFTNNVSFDNKELEKICNSLNDKLNNQMIKYRESNNLEMGSEIVQFEILPLSVAIENFEDICRTLYSETDESY